jgi:transcriptional regulator with XRE-family HTH domain
LRDSILKTGYTYKEISLLSGLSSATIAKVLKGYLVWPKTCIKLANALGIAANKLFI